MYATNLILNFVFFFLDKSESFWVVVSIALCVLENSNTCINNSIT